MITTRRIRVRDQSTDVVHHSEFYVSEYGVRYFNRCGSQPVWAAEAVETADAVTCLECLSR